MPTPPSTLDAFREQMGQWAQDMGLIDGPANYLEAQQPKVGYRASMLPIGNYEDGSIAFPVWPQVAVDAYEAMGRFGRGENPQPQDAVLAGLAMMGGIAMPRPAGSIGMAGRPRQMPEPGMLAEAGLTRMRAEDAVKPRPFPDAPQNLPELESYLQKNVDGNSRARADEAWAEDPTRYNAYSHGMADVLNPESQWWKGEPTLQSGGALVPLPVSTSPEANYLAPMITPQADVYEALRRDRLNDPPMYRVQTPPGGWQYRGIPDQAQLEQLDADLGRVMKPGFDLLGPSGR